VAGEDTHPGGTGMVPQVQSAQDLDWVWVAITVKMVCALEWQLKASYLLVRTMDSSKRLLWSVSSLSTLGLCPYDVGSTPYRFLQLRYFPMTETMQLSTQGSLLPMYWNIASSSGCIWTPHMRGREKKGGVQLLPHPLIWHHPFPMSYTLCVWGQNITQEDVRRDILM
jgi:hypothetical protein